MVFLLSSTKTTKPLGNLLSVKSNKTRKINCINFLFLLEPKNMKYEPNCLWKFFWKKKIWNSKFGMRFHSTDSSFSSSMFVRINRLECNHHHLLCRCCCRWLSLLLLLLLLLSFLFLMWLLVVVSVVDVVVTVRCNCFSCCCS